MQNLIIRPMTYLSAFMACGIMALTTGCASGGFKLTRQYAGFVNRQNIIIRIILYILTGVVFAATMLIDLVIFNTMDFWEGRVSQGTYEFSKDGKTFVARHEILPDSRKKSTLQVLEENKVLQVVELVETANGEIEMSIDGKLHTRVRDVHSLPVASLFNAQGQLVRETLVILDPTVHMISRVQAP